MLLQSDQATPLTFAVRHINSSSPVPIAEADLLAALTADETSFLWQHHAHAFFDETDIETLSDIVRSGILSYAQLARGGHRHLPPDHKTRLWLDERA